MSNKYIGCDCGNRLDMRLRTGGDNEIITCECGQDYAVEYTKHLAGRVTWKAAKIDGDDMLGMAVAIILRRGVN